MMVPFLTELLKTSTNKLSKEIGMLCKNGKAQEVNIFKEKTGTLKEDSKRLGDDLGLIAEELQNLLYQIPNIPQESVPAGNTDEDNEEIFKEGAGLAFFEGPREHTCCLPCIAA